MYPRPQPELLQHSSRSVQGLSVYIPDSGRANEELGPPCAQLLRSRAAKFATRNHNPSNFL